MVFGINSYRFRALGWATFGSMVYGFDSGITTVVLGYPAFLEYYTLNSNTIGAFNSSYYAAAAAGSMLNWYLPNKIGRVRTIQLDLVVSVIGIVIQIASQNYGMFIAGRVIGGLAVGSLFAVCPVLASEISPPEYRGRVGIVWAINVAMGYMITEWLGVAFYFIHGDASFRVLFALQLVPTFIMLVGSFFMPKSPRWLIFVDRYNDALAVLRRFHQNSTDTLLTAEDEFKQIKAQVELDKEEKLGLVSIFRKASYRRRLALVMGFFLFQQLTGIIPMSNYQVIIYQLVGFDRFTSLILTACFGTVAVISCLLAIPIDKLGRRAAIFSSYFFLTTGTLLIVVLWSQFDASGATQTGFGKGVIFAMFWWMFGYAGVQNTFGAVYSAEIMPTNIRAAGVACGYAIFNAIVILLVQITPLAVEYISWRYFIVFLCADVAFVIVFYFFYPETKNRSLEELEAVFGDKVVYEVAIALENVEGKKTAAESAHYESPAVSSA